MQSCEGAGDMSAFQGQQNKFVSRRPWAEQPTQRHSCPNRRLFVPHFRLIWSWYECLILIWVQGWAINSMYIVSDTDWKLRCVFVFQVDDGGSTTLGMMGRVRAVPLGLQSQTRTMKWHLRESELLSRGGNLETLCTKSSYSHLNRLSHRCMRWPHSRAQFELTRVQDC